MRYDEAKKQSQRYNGTVQRLLVSKVAENIVRRYATYARLYEQGQINSASVSPAAPINRWLNGKQFEDTYLRDTDPEEAARKARGHTKSTRQEWTKDRVMKEASEATVGANQTIDWFLVRLGKRLSKRIPGYVVTVHLAASSSREHPSSPTLSFIVKPVSKTVT